MQYFASFQPFEIFEEFNGVSGTYIKSFLISDKINLNDWQATHEGNIANLDDAIGRPGIHYINPVTGKRDHTGAPTKKQSEQLQELYRAASIIVVGSDVATREMWQMSKMIDDDIATKIRSKEIKFISPSIWPKEDSVEIINQTNGKQIQVVHDYDWLHYAFVDEPAYGDAAEIKSFCDGTTKACQLELQKFDASINNVENLTEHKIIIPEKEKKKQENTSDNKAITSDNQKYTSQGSMTTEEDLRKQNSALKAELDDIKKKQEEAKKATEEKEKEKLATELEEKEKLSKAKKAEDEEDKEEKIATLQAKVTSLEASEKSSLTESIISAQLTAGIISQESIPSEKATLMKSDLGSLKAKYEVIKPFEAKIKETSVPASATSNVGYLGTSSLDASYSGSDAELFQEVVN